MITSSDVEAVRARLAWINEEAMYQEPLTTWNAVQAASAMLADLVQERDDIRQLGRAVIARLSKGRDAPAHVHIKPGAWDDSNHPGIAGKPCSWCATWKAFVEAIEGTGDG